MSRTTIEWVARPGTIPESLNMTSGCTKISAGCRNCWAERMARRLAGQYGYPERPHHFDVTLHPGRLEEPLKWRKPRTVLISGMGDLFHKDVPTPFIADVWKAMYYAQDHTFLILTKRPERMQKVFTTFAKEMLLPNAWLGTTIELPEYSYRAQYLRETPAAVRYISFEPLLSSFADYPGVLDEIDWCIAGGESGPGARPMHPDWVRVLRDQCQMTKTQFFFKQHGAWLHESQLVPANEGQDMPFWEKWCYNKAKTYRWPDGSISYRVGKTTAGRLLDGREWNEFPG